MRSWLEDMLDDLRLALTGPSGRWRAVRLGRGPLAGVILILLCTAVYLPGTFRTPPVDRDESRFAQASRQMFESIALEETDPALHDGGLVVPKVRDKPRLNKPPLIYWAQTASAAVLTGGDPTRDAIWMYRLPSALFATIAVLATWRLGVSMFDPRTGFAAAALLAVCPMVVWDAHQARADQLLLACTTTAIWAMWASIRNAEKKARAAHAIKWLSPPSVPSALFWAAVALGVLAKGPITPMIAALTLLAYTAKTRSLAPIRALTPAPGLLIAALLIAPWAIAVINHVGFSNYWEIVFGETVGRSGSAMEGHWGPPGYHLVLLVPLFWPGVLLTSAAIARAGSLAQGGRHVAPRDDDDDGDITRLAPPLLVRMRAGLRSIVGRAAGRRAELFCLCWILPAWTVFELVATKLPHYTLPLYPAVALLTARALLSAADRSLRGVDSWSAMLGHKVWLVVGAVIVAGLPLGLAIPFGGWASKLAAALIAAVSFWILWRAWRRLTMNQFGGAQILSVIAVTVALAGTLGLLLPSADGLWISPKLDAIVRAHDPDRQRPLASVGYHEDSLVFLTRGRLQTIDDADGWIRANPRGILIAPPGDLDPASLSGPELTELGRVRGYNYSNGELMDLIVYRAGP